MIKIIDKKDCCGCGACVQKCPKQCISFQEDNEGFLYPIVNETICIDCKLCEKVCPIINKLKPQELPKTLIALKHIDEKIRKTSSSGGAFTAIASKIIKNGGVVFGAQFNHNWKVIHSYTETIAGLDAFRGSKYVQSEIGNSYKEVELFLKSDRIVLFTGTPCQVSGLYNFLQKKYDNLYTLDFVCHGVPSPGVFRWYLQEELNRSANLNNKNTIPIPPIRSIPKEEIKLPKGIKIQNIYFRDKINGWKKYNFSLHLTKSLENGEKESLIFSNNTLKNSYLYGFISDIYLRPSCFKCPTKSLTSSSDFTIGDFWGQEFYFPEFDNDTGVSAVIPNTPKAKDFINGLDNVLLLQKPFNIFLKYNPSIAQSATITTAKKIIQKKFWHNIGKYPFAKNLKRSTHLSILERIFIKINNK